MLNFIFARDLLSAFGLNQKKIHQILNKEGETKIEELLAEEETIAECKQQNQKLLDFLCKRENLSQLIKYATRLPEDPDNQDQAHKFPFVATDILTSCIRIADSLVKIKEVIQPAEPEETVLTGSANEEKRVETDEDETEAKAIQKVLQKVQDEVNQEKQNNNEPQKQMVVEDLNEIELVEDEDSLETNQKNGEEENGSQSKKEPDSQKEGIDKDQNEDDEVNVDEDDTDENGSLQKLHIQVSKMNSKPSLLNNKKDILDENYDYTLLDELFSILEQNEEVQPILCGYFNKIVQTLLGKIKQKLLAYILIERQGDVFNKLFDLLEHHSLAQLMVELLTVKIGNPIQRKQKLSVDYDFMEDLKDNNNNDYEEQKEAVTEGAEGKMLAVHNLKKKEIIQALLDNLSNKNQDFEKCLNANAILQELAENENVYECLIYKENISQLIQSSCDTRNPNQAYALGLLITIIKEFPERDSQIGSILASEFQETIATFFFDLTYSSILVLRSSDYQLGEADYINENQSGVRHKRFGQKRLKALELLRQEFQTFSKYVELNSDQYISKILRRQIVSAMLDVIEEYEFCSIACHQAILVLDFLKNTFDDEDLESMKSFVQRNLCNRTYFEFESGRQTTNIHLAAIIKMGLVLKQITLEGGLLQLDEHKQGDSQSSYDRSLKHLGDTQWTDFCSGELKLFETKWNKRLEDYGKPDETDTGFKFNPTIKDDESRRILDSDEAESSISNMLQVGVLKQRMIKQRNKTQQPPADFETLEREEEEQKQQKDDQEVKSSSFQDYQYWKLPEQYNVDDLLNEEQLDQ